MISIQVQQDPNSESVAWEVEGPWDVEVAAAVIEAIEETVESATKLGISLWDAMAPRAPAGMVDFQVQGRPKFKRCLTFKVRLNHRDVKTEDTP